MIILADFLMKAEEIDLKFSIGNNFSVNLEIPPEDGQSDEDKTIVKVQVLADSTEDKNYIIDFKRLEGDFFVFNDCYK